MRREPQGREEVTYSTAGDLVVCGLAGNLEGDIVGGVGLDLDGAGSEVVEVLVEELYCAQRSQWLATHYSACMGSRAQSCNHGGGGGG